MRLRSDGLAAAALLGLPVMELLEGLDFANWAAALIAGLSLVLLAWVLRPR